MDDNEDDDEEEEDDEEDDEEVDVFNAVSEENGLLHFDVTIAVGAIGAERNAAAPQ